MVCGRRYAATMRSGSSLPCQNFTAPWIARTRMSGSELGLSRSRAAILTSTPLGGFLPQRFPYCPATRTHSGQVRRTS